MHKIVNGIRVELTSKEIAERQAEIDAYNNDAFNRQLEKLREERNDLLTESDWTVLPDSPIADKTAWQTYRTKLRDLTNGLTTVEEVEAAINSDLKAKMNEMANDPKQSNYAQQRRNAYPEIGDQLDMIWHSIDQDPQLKSKYFDFYEAIKAVKVKYPKNG